LEKNDPLREDFENFVPKGLTICANFVKFGRPEIGKVVRYLHDKKIGWRSRSRFYADRAQNLPGPAPDNILGVSQISSKSVHFRKFRRRYSRTRERRSNAPQSVFQYSAKLLRRVITANKILPAIN